MPLRTTSQQPVKTQRVSSVGVGIGWLLGILMVATTLGACDQKRGEVPHGAPEGRAAPAQSVDEYGATNEGNSSTPAAAAEAAPNAPVVLALGDSLTAGLGLSPDQAYPAQLEIMLRKAGYPHRVVNGGVSGDTSAGGLARTDWLLRQRPDVVILALGANDGLRGLQVEQMQDNLDAIILKCRAAGAQVLLAGMIAPQNLGKDYTSRFQSVYPALAKKHDLPLMPFLLEGVLGQGNLNQADGIHPNADGARVVAENVWKSVEPMLIK